MFAWSYAQALQAAREAAQAQARRQAVDRERPDVLRRVVLANKVLASDAFHAAMNSEAHYDRRAAATREEDLVALSLDILRDLGVDLEDITLRLRRVQVDVGRGRKAQLAIRAVPTVESGARAIAQADQAGAARAAGDLSSPSPPHLGQTTDPR